MCSCQKQSCGCANGNCGCSCHRSAGACGGCGQKNCTCGSNNSGGSCSSKFLELADQAWMEVLKEKIKDHIRANNKNIDELAKLVSEANHERWKKKIEEKSCCGGFEEKLRNFFANSCKCK